MIESIIPFPCPKSPDPERHKDVLIGKYLDDYHTQLSGTPEKMFSIINNVRSLITQCHDPAIYARWDGFRGTFLTQIKNLEMDEESKTILQELCEEPLEIRHTPGEIVSFPSQDQANQNLV